MLCECVRDGCAARVEVPRHVYEDVRATPDRFVVTPHHERPDGERVVAGEATYRVVSLTPAREAVEMPAA